MLDHVGMPVSDYAASKAFYLKVLSALGYGLVMELSSEETGGQNVAGFGAGGHPQFWIATGQPIQGRVHFAFTAKDRAAVRGFHAAALQVGGKDNGAPGLRPHYHDNYYGAFVLDLDGHNIEAVCHLKE